jgi:hypothetical protein
LLSHPLDNSMQDLPFDALGGRSLNPQGNPQQAGAPIQVADLHAGHICVTPDQAPQPVPVHFKEQGHSVDGFPTSFPNPLVKCLLEKPYVGF